MKNLKKLAEFKQKNTNTMLSFNSMNLITGGATNERTSGETQFDNNGCSHDTAYRIDGELCNVIYHAAQCKE